jgi:recombination protein U
MTIEEYKRIMCSGRGPPSKNCANRLRGKANRELGGEFENLIAVSCEHYRLKGVADIEKTPEPMKIIKSMGNGQYTACFQQKAQPDYKGTLHGGKSVVFEAKHTVSDRFTQNRVTPVQAKALASHALMGANCFVLAGFAMNAFYRIPWDSWCNMSVFFGRKYVRESDLAQYKIPFEHGCIRFLG